MFIIVNKALQCITNIFQALCPIISIYWDTLHTGTVISIFEELRTNCAQYKGTVQNVYV